MANNASATVVGVFAEHEQAERAITELRGAGFADNQLAVVTQEQQPEKKGAGDRSTGPPSMRTGAGMGMLTGAALGGLASGTLPGLLAIGVVGGMIGALIDLGIREPDARWYQEQAEAGQSVVVVQAADRVQKAVDLLRDSGAQRVRSGSPSDTEETV